MDISALQKNTDENMVQFDRQRFYASLIDYFRNQAKVDHATTDEKESYEKILSGLQKLYTFKEEDLPILIPQVDANEVFNASPLGMPIDVIKALTLQIKALPAPTPEIIAKAEKLKQDGNEHMKTESFPDAVEAYSSAIAINPQNPIFYCNRAAAATKMKEFQGAVEDCKIAINLDDKYAKAYARLGQALTHTEKYDEAKAAFVQAIGLDDQNEDLYRENIKTLDEKLAEQGENLTSVEGGDAKSNLSMPGLGSNPLEAMMSPEFTNYMSEIMQKPEFQQVMQLGQQMMMSNPQIMEEMTKNLMPGLGGGMPGMGQFPPKPDNDDNDGSTST